MAFSDDVYIYEFKKSYSPDKVYIINKNDADEAKEKFNLVLEVEENIYYSPKILNNCFLYRDNLSERIRCNERICSLYGNLYDEEEAYWDSYVT